MLALGAGLAAAGLAGATGLPGVDLVGGLVGVAAEPGFANDVFAILL